MYDAVVRRRLLNSSERTSVSHVCMIAPCPLPRTPSDIPRLSFSEPVLDTFFAPMLRPGHVLELTGPAGCGKTALMLQLALCAARDGGSSVLLLTEPFPARRFAQIADARGVNDAALARVVLNQCASLDALHSALTSLLPSPGGSPLSGIMPLATQPEEDAADPRAGAWGVRVVVVDSVAAPFRALSSPPPAVPPPRRRLSGPTPPPASAPRCGGSRRRDGSPWWSPTTPPPPPRRSAWGRRWAVRGLRADPTRGLCCRGHQGRCGGLGWRSPRWRPRLP